MHSYWVVNEEDSYGVIVAESYDKADARLFLGICQNRFPCDAILIEMIPDDDAEPIEDSDIISIEEVT